jgi:hypothetical protein
VVAGHVFYNAGALQPFARALDAHALRRVVTELTASHPLEWMRDLWLRFHGLERPSGPRADDAVTVLHDLGFDVHREVGAGAGAGFGGGGGFVRREDAIHIVRKRLCLPAERDPEIEHALGGRLQRIDGLWDVGPPDRTLVTLWWDRA